MSRARGVVLFVLMTAVVASSVAAPATSGAATEPTGPVETPDGVETASQTEPTPTPDDGPDGHADDPFPRWLPVAFAGVLVAGIAVVGVGLWAALARGRRFFGR